MTFKKILLTVALCAGLNCYALADDVNTVSSSLVTPVAGTDLAHLYRATDVVRQIPNIDIVEDHLEVVGSGEAAVYIGKRRVVNISELDNIAAYRIKDVTVNASPGATFDKDVPAVVVITLSEEEAEGLKLDDNLRMEFNSVPMFSNRLTMGYRYKKLNLTTLIAFDQHREHVHKTEFEDYFNGVSCDFVLQQRVINRHSPNNHSQRLTAGLGLDYDLTANQRIHVGYQAILPLLARSRDNNGRYTVCGLSPDGGLDLDNPVTDYSQASRERTPFTQHDVRAEYQGDFGKVKLYAGNNSVWTVNNSHSVTLRPVPILNGDEHFLRHSLRIRNYLQAVMPVAKGNVSAGAEYQYRHMNVSFDNLMNTTVGRIHGAIDAGTTAAYASLNQQFGIVQIEAGLRYENIAFKYKALPDDENLQVSVFEHFTLKKKDDFFYPSLAVKVKLGQSFLNLRYTRSHNKPDPANIRFVVMDVFNVATDMLYVERVSATTLGWQWKWLNLNATYKHFCDPLFNTTDGKVDFNGKDYDGLDLGVEVNPTVGIWHPALSFHCHKQWLNMQLANGQKRANNPNYTMQFNNTFTLPNMWFVRLNCKYRSGGFVRNVRYYKDNVQIDASLSKEFLNKHLVVEASLENLLRDSWEDVTIFGSWKTLQAKGYKTRVPRTATISVKYRL